MTDMPIYHASELNPDTCLEIAMFLFEILVEIIHFNLFISCACSHTIQRKTAFLRLKRS